MNNETNSSGRIIAGLVVIAAGILILLDNLNVLPWNWTEIVFSLPMLLIVIGILSLTSTKKSFTGIIFLVIGVALLIPRIYAGIYIGWNVIIPVLIIFLGSRLLFKGREGRRTYFLSSAETNADVLDEVFVFGGSEKSVHSQNFQGGEIVAIFGGAQINLTGCKMQEDKQVIDLVAVFGGVTLIVPSDWNVTLKVTPVFGGFSNKVYRAPVEIPGGKNLIVKGLVVFGGGEIKYR